MTTPAKPLSSSLKKVISTRVKADGVVILGISGGPDSVALLHLLWESGFRPVLAHVNYHLRGRDSNTDQKFVEKLAKKYQLQCEILQASPAMGNLEESCRNLRYKFFEEIRLKHHADAILVAHTQNDQIETFLLNLTRGASLRGFQAMSEWDSERQLLRPLLNTPKKDLLAYLKKHHLPSRQDRSNKDLKFSRNFLRHKVIPLFEKLNPNFLKTLAVGIQNLSENVEVIESLSTTWLKKNLQCSAPKTSTTQPASAKRIPIPSNSTPTFTFPLEKFLQQTPALQKNILRRLFQQLNQKSLTHQTLEEILRTLTQNRAGLRKEFGHNYQLKIEKTPLNKTAPSKTTRQVKISPHCLLNHSRLK
jgi:tRNA(Ile)-lysidine synthetase-like protein